MIGSGLVKADTEHSTREELQADRVATRGHYKTLVARMDRPASDLSSRAPARVDP